MKLKVVVAALALFASAVVADAALVPDSAWFSLEGSSDPAVTATGGPAQTLIIDKPLGPGLTTLTIGYNFTSAMQFGNFSPMISWGFTLGPVDLMGGTSNVTAGNGNFAPSQASGYDSNRPDIDPSASLFSAGAFSNTALGGNGLVFLFDIVINKADAATETTDIFGDLFGQFSGNGVTAWSGSFGPNAGRFGWVNYNDRTGELPVITINNLVPEPATLSLLALGGLVMLRRRRR